MKTEYELWQDELSGRRQRPFLMYGLGLLVLVAVGAAAFAVR